MFNPALGTRREEQASGVALTAWEVCSVKYQGPKMAHADLPANDGLEV